MQIRLLEPESTLTLQSVELMKNHNSNIYNKGLHFLLLDRKRMNRGDADSV